MYRATLFQRNIVSESDKENINLVNGFNNALVEILESQLTVKTAGGKLYNYPLQYSEQDFMSTTHLGKFANGTPFRLIQRKGASLEIAKAKFGAVGAFTIGSISPNGWAIHFYLTTEKDVRDVAIVESGSNDQIQKLIDGSLMSLQFNMSQKFVEFSKRLLLMIEKEPSQLLKFNRAKEFVEIMKRNTDSYSYQEQQIIRKI